MAEKILISAYNNVTDKTDKDTGLDDFLTGIKGGKWQDRVLHVRTLQDHKERATAKQKCPLVRVSGSFSGQSDKDLRRHSGFIAIDLDSIENPNSVKELLANDRYVYAAFISISGTGLCLLFRIDGTRHLDSFEGISAYLYESYQLITDQTGKNVSRARFVSYDPYMVLNTDALLFKKYLTKKKAVPRNQIAFVKSDFEEIVTQLYNRGVNICEDYSEWVSCAYALISEFGELGLPYFHTLSSLSGKYAESDCDKQYENCLRNHRTGTKLKTATIGSIYFYAKQAGISIYSATTKQIIRATTQQVKAGGSVQSVSEYLEKFEALPSTHTIPVIEQVISKGVTYESENIIEDIVTYLVPYKLRKNVITRNVEMNGRQIDDSDINSIYIDLRSLNDKITKDLVCSVIFSNRIEQFNPIREFLSESTYDLSEGTPNLDMLLDGITTTTPNYKTWVTKWLVSLIASADGNYSPLTLVFAGEKQGTGKTHWFRYLLPKRIRFLYAESDMDAGKDDEILMTKKWIILDDEYGGKSKREYTKQKKVTSKEWVNVREPYGRVYVDLRRLSMFAGTSNDLQIIFDPTGNRRVLVVHITEELDRTLYNHCDKTWLFHELNALYKSGYDYTVLRSEIKQLNDNTEEFKQSSHEEELVSTKLTHGSVQSGEWLTITEIIQYLISDTKITSMSNTKIGMILTNLNFVREKKWNAEVRNSSVKFFIRKISRTGDLNY